MAKLLKMRQHTGFDGRLFQLPRFKNEMKVQSQVFLRKEKIKGHGDFVLTSIQHGFLLRSTERVSVITGGKFRP